MSIDEVIVRIGENKFIVEINDTTNTGVMLYEEAKAYAKGKRRSSTNYKTYDVEKQGGKNG